MTTQPPATSPAEALYRQAHALHWDERSLEPAEKIYEQVIEEYPDSKEAGYARTQLENIAVLRRPPPPPRPADELLAERYRCPVCHMKTPITRRFSLGEGQLYRDPRMASFTAVTCTTCGHTNLFDFAIMAVWISR